MRFDASHRLKTNSDFTAVFKAARPASSSSGTFGRRFQFESLYIYVRLNTTKPRLGLSVSKKVSKKAAVRNRIKRCLREAFRKELESIKADFVVRMMSQPEINNRKYYESIFNRLKSNSNFNNLLNKQALLREIV